MVVGNAARIVEAKQPLKMVRPRQGAAGGAGLLRGDRKALVVLRQIGGEDSIGFGERTGTGAPEFLDQAVL